MGEFLEYIRQVHLKLKGVKRSPLKGRTPDTKAEEQSDDEAEFKLIEKLR